MDQFVTQLEQTLRQVVSSTDTQAIQRASEQLKSQFYAQPEVVPALVQILQRHEDPTLRQIAGVEARKELSKFWVSEKNPLPAEVKANIRAALLQSTLAEQNALVRHTSSRVIAAIAIFDLEDNSWPELLPLLIETGRSGAVHEREVAIYIIYTVLDQVQSDAVSAVTQGLFELLSERVKDTESLQVRVSSVLALVRFCIYLQGADSCELFQSVVPSIVETLSQAVAEGDEKSANQIFESLNEIVLDDPALLGNHLVDLIKHMINDYALSASVETEFRTASLDVVFHALKGRSRRIQSLQLGPWLTESCVRVLATPSDDEDEEDVEDDETSPSQVAARIIDFMSSSFPPSQVMAPLLQMLPALVSGSPHEARAGFLALSFSIEGAPEHATNEIETIINAIVQGLNNPAEIVKMSALQALTMLAVELPRLIGDEHEHLLPLVFNIMDSAASLKIARAASVTLDSILETLEGDVITERYLDALVPKLLHLVQQHDDLQLKGHVVTAIGSAAFAAGRNFMPFYERTVKVIQQFLIVPTEDEEVSDELVKLSGLTLDTFGTIGLAVGRDAFRTCLESCMMAALSFLRLKMSNLHEAAFVFIGVVARVFGDEFTPYLPMIMPPLLETFDQEEISIDDSKDTDAAVGVIDDDEGDDFMDNVNVNSAIAIEKEFACDTLADIVCHVAPDAFATYMEAVLEKLALLCDHFYEDIRRAALVAFWRIVKAYYTLEKGANNWVPGYPCTSNTPLSAPLTHIIEKAWQASMEPLRQDSELTVVSMCFNSITSALKTCGPEIILAEENLKAFIDTIVEVLSKAHACQGDLDDFDRPKFDAEDLNETEEALIDIAIDAIVQVAAVMGENFKVVFPVVATALAGYVTSKSQGERTSGVGAYAELVQSLKHNVTPYTKDLCHTFVTGLEDKKLSVRSVAAFGFGMLAYYSAETETVQQCYPVVLNLLQRLLAKVDKVVRRRAKTAADEEESHNDDRSLANACGCIARMTTCHPTFVPLAQVVPTLLSRLPLKDAFEENEPIFELLWMLTENKPEVPTEIIQANVHEIVRVLVEVLEYDARCARQNETKSQGSAPAIPQLGEPQTLQFAKQLAKNLVSANAEIGQTYPLIQALIQ